VRIVPEFPPNYAEIQAAFPGIRGRKPFFAWGDIIYNPHRVVIPPELVAHEAVHAQRQGVSPGLWWQRYIADPRFRLMEELLAHVAEYRAYVDNPNCNRHGRRAALKAIAGRLASPLYGGLISARDAMIAIAEPEKPFRTRLPEQGAAAI
jgi:hypothetical protein